MFNLYPGRISDDFADLLELYAWDEVDLIEFLLGDGQ